MNTKLARVTVASRRRYAAALPRLVAVGVLLAMSVGCGDDDDNPSKPDGSVGGNAGHGGMDGGSGKGGASGSSAGKGGNSTAGTSGTTGAGTGGTMGLPMPSCDTSIPTTATCGGTSCPAATSPIAAFVCSVPCCLPDDTCGLRRAYMNAPTDCAGPAVPDPSCPSRAGMAAPGMPPADGGAGNEMLGCCAPSGFCGVITMTDGSCITSSPLLPDLMPGMPCGSDMDGGTEDAGK